MESVPRFANRGELFPMPALPVPLAPSLALRDRAIQAAEAFEVSERYESSLSLIDLVKEVLGETLPISEIKWTLRHEVPVPFAAIDGLSVTFSESPGKLTVGMPCLHCDGRVNVVIASLIELGQEIKARNLCVRCAAGVAR